MIFVAFGLLFIAGGVALFIIAPTKKAGFLMGGLSLMVGVVIVISGVVKWVNSDSVDLERRTVFVTTVVVEAREVEEAKEGCIQIFTLANVPYTFYERCSNFVKYSSPFPRVGDEVQILFVHPKNMGGKPNVLEFYNLTQARERLRSLEAEHEKSLESSPSVPEVQPAD